MGKPSIFVISLATARTRKKAICEEFRKHNIGFEFFDVVGGF